MSENRRGDFFDSHCGSQQPERTSYLVDCNFIIRHVALKSTVANYLSQCIVLGVAAMLDCCFVISPIKTRTVS